jgi:thermitase
MAAKHNIWRGVVVPARQIGVLFASLLAATVLLLFSAAAQGETVAVDRSPAGAPYVAGELIVTYEEGAGERAVETLDEEAGAEVEQDLPALDARLLAFPGLKRDPSRDSRERDLEEIKDDLAQDPAVESVEYNYLGHLAYTPDDPKFRYQWGLRKPGFQDAWDLTRGSGVDVAVVDTGADVGHVDLRLKVAQARDIVNDDGTVRDLSGHGTHVAGIIAADTGNHKGIAGGCPNCDLLVAKVFDGKNTGTVARFAEGIRWSADHGAEVINLSFTHPLASTVEKNAIDYARGKGAVIVAAAGNKDTNKRTYPAAYVDSVIAVAATNRQDRRAAFSNYGGWVDVAAPGVEVLSTIPGGYASWSGTSMATPHVSALAGLLASQGRSRANIETRITYTALDLGPRGRDPYYGAGRISADRAVR